MSVISSSDMRIVLSALERRLSLEGERFDLVVIGGSALIALGLADRTTRDVDVVALHDAGKLTTAQPLPAALSRARDRVAEDFALAADWLNADPTDILRLGLPEGFLERSTLAEIGPFLSLRFASRLDQIHFKLHALVDRGPGRHEADLRGLAPTIAELQQAAAWTRTHDPSPGFADMLAAALRHLGAEDGDAGAP